MTLKISCPSCSYCDWGICNTLRCFWIKCRFFLGVDHQEARSQVSSRRRSSVLAPAGGVNLGAMLSLQLLARALWGESCCPTLLFQNSLCSEAQAIHSAALPTTKVTKNEKYWYKRGEKSIYYWQGAKQQLLQTEIMCLSRAEMRFCIKGLLHSSFLAVSKRWREEKVTYFTLPLKILSFLLNGTHC